MTEFIIAALLLELTPGPNMAYLATVSLSRGRFIGLITVLGIALGLATQSVLVALGAGALIERSVILYEVLRWIGVAYLFFLAWEGWQTPAENSPARADLGNTVGPQFFRGFLSNVFNPKSIIFFVSVVPQFVQSNPNALSVPMQMTVLGSLYVVIATTIHAIIVLLAAQLNPWLNDERRKVVTRRVLSIALALVAIWLAWATRR